MVDICKVSMWVFTKCAKWIWASIYKEEVLTEVNVMLVIPSAVFIEVCILFTLTLCLITTVTLSKALEWKLIEVVYSICKFQICIFDFHNSVKWRIPEELHYGIQWNPLFRTLWVVGLFGRMCMFPNACLYKSQIFHKMDKFPSHTSTWTVQNHLIMQTLCKVVCYCC